MEVLVIVSKRVFSQAHAVTQLQMCYRTLEAMLASQYIPSHHG